jgi:dienelactone hydrolase
MRFELVKLPVFVAVLLTLSVARLFAQAPSSDAPFAPIKRILPPEGIEIPAEVKEGLTKELQSAYQRYEPLKKHALAADIEVFLKGVKYALDLREFYDPKDFAKADALLKEANLRIDQLAAGKSPWTTATGLVVRGYFSSIDNSAQPYGLVIPKNFDFEKSAPLYTWLHGRGDKATDLHFITERMNKPGEITPPDAIVVHAFGRQCVGFLGAGEVDVIDVTLHVEQQYKTDPKRRVLMGFSMGGAGAWHVGAHHAHMFRVISPGAGFAETAKYQRLKPEDYPPWYEQKLWGQNDAPAYVRNLFNSEVIAYSGELDRQIQAARVMEAAFEAEGRKLTHLIGPNTEHKYEPKTKADLLKKIADALKNPRPDEPNETYVQTRSLAYFGQGEIFLVKLEEHWQDSRVDRKNDGDNIDLRTKNIAMFSLFFPTDDLKADRKLAITVDGQEFDFTLQRRENFNFDNCVFAKNSGKWSLLTKEQVTSLVAKRFKTVESHGPIDDAFRSKFLVVTPSGKSKNARFQAWQDFELAHFRDRWRALMRGDIREKKDVEVTERDMRDNHLILWGDENSNSVVNRVAVQLPIRRSGNEWSVNGEKYDTSNHTPVLIYPNPLTATESVSKYIVLNSGLTFREAHDRTNSLQNPKLPDWAMIDLTQPPDASAPGKIAAAGFFDENWQLKPPPRP